MLILAEIQNYFLVSVLVAFFLLVCVVLILTILIQRPQGGGLSAAFGAGAGGGAGQTAFGTKTGDALTYATIAMFVIYLGFAISLNYIARPSGPAPGQAIIAPDEREERRQGAGTAPADEPARDAEAPTPQPPIVPEVDDAPPETDDSPENEVDPDGDPNG